MKTNSSFIICILFSILAHTQTMNREVLKEGRSPYLIGKIDKSGLTSDNYNTWFSKNYETYQIDKETIKKLQSQLSDYKILVFMGTWCGDSKRRVPEFYKVLEASNFPENQLQVIAVSNESNLYKQSPNHEEAGLNIHRVPTFIFYKNGKEVNRIVEEPVISFEKDILTIITSNNYESNYAIVDKIHTILTTKGVKGLKKDRNDIVKKYEDKVGSMYELNTYAKVLKTINKKEHALEVLKMNILLFPKEYRTYLNLAKFQKDNGNKEGALKTLKKGLEALPENKVLSQKVKSIEL